MNSTLVPFSESTVLRAFGEEVHIHLGAAQTGGAFCMFTEITLPGGGPPPHWHDHEDEWFHVLEGTVSFLIHDQWTEAKAGDSVLVVRGQVHTFKNNTDQPTRMLVQTSPAGFEKFFTAAAEEFARPEGPDMQRAIQIAESHGIHFVAP